MQTSLAKTQAHCR